MTYKVINLFGEEEVKLVSGRVGKPNLFDNHDAFVEKFEAKKTTDDCYTPPEVYDIVLKYVRRHCDIDGREIIRPFYPGGDYESIDYGDGVVIDNPPFSIITPICRFYLSRNIPFFLFAPHLTLFSSDIDATHIVVGGDITYENGAIVKTSFLSNMFGNAKVIGDPNLYVELSALKNRVSLPKYEYPNNILTVSKVAYMVEKGVSFRVDKKHAKHYRQMDAQKIHKKTLFGSGFLISDEAAAEKAAAEKAAAEKENIIEWELSEKEKEIIKSLGK